MWVSGASFKMGNSANASSGVSCPSRILTENFTGAVPFASLDIFLISSMISWTACTSLRRPAPRWRLTCIGNGHPMLKSISVNPFCKSASVSVRNSFMLFAIICGTVFAQSRTSESQACTTELQSHASESGCCEPEISKSRKSFSRGHPFSIRKNGA